MFRQRPARWFPHAAILLLALSACRRENAAHDPVSAGSKPAASTAQPWPGPTGGKGIEPEVPAGVVPGSSTLPEQRQQAVLPSYPFEVTVRAASLRYSVKGTSGKEQAILNGVKTDLYNEAKAGVPIEFTVINRSATTRVIGYWTCSYYENWRTDSADVTIVAWSCYDNGVRAVTIPPDESFTGEVRVAASSRLIGHNTTFRMAFLPYNDPNDEGGSHRVLGEFWSDPLTFKVVK